MNRNFGYISDPLFVLCIVIYITNKWIILGSGSVVNTFQLNYLNDVLLVPCCIPILLYFVDRLGHRVATPPTITEIVVCLILWSVILEYVGPKFLSRGTADPLDVVAYWSGGIVSWFLWKTFPLSWGWVRSSLRTRLGLNGGNDGK